MRAAVASLALLATAAAGTAAAAPAASCSHFFPDAAGIAYDLGSVPVGPGGLSVEQDGIKHTFSVCGPLAAGCGADDPNAAMCDSAGPGAGFPVADWPAAGSSQLSWSLLDAANATSGVRLSISNKECDYEGVKLPHVLNYDMACAATSEPRVTLVEDVSNLTDCVTTVRVESSGACPSRFVDRCTFISPQSARYDLAPLRLPYGGGAAAAYSVAGDSVKYLFNVCGRANGCDGNSTMACGQEGGGRGQFVVSDYEPTDRQWSQLDESDASAGVRYTTSDGTPCDYEGIELPRVVNYDFHCDPAGTPGKLSGLTYSSHANLSSCVSTFEIRTASACPVE